MSGVVIASDASDNTLGVAPEANLIHGAVGTNCDPRYKTKSSQIIKAIEWAINEDAAVISGNYYFTKSDRIIICLSMDTNMERRKLLGAMVPLAVSGCLRLEEADENGDAGQQVAFDEEGNGEQQDGSADTTEEDDGDEDDSGEDDSDGASDDDDDEDEGVSYPTGLSDEGVSPLLAHSHRNSLDMTSVVFELEIINSGPHRHDEQWKVDLAEGSQAILEMHQLDASPTAYFSPDHGHWRDEILGEVKYGRHRHDFDVDWLLKIGHLGHLIRAGEWDPPTVDEDAELFYIEAEGLDEPSGLADDIWTDSIESFQASGTVDEEGIIRELEVAFEHVDEDVLTLRHSRVTTEEIGEVSVNAPEWLDTAQERAPEVVARFVEDRQFIELTMEGGNSMPSGTNLNVHGNDGDYPFPSLSEPLVAGDTLTLYVEDGEGIISREGIPQDASPITFEQNIAIWMRGSALEYFFIDDIS